MSDVDRKKLIACLEGFKRASNYKAVHNLQENEFISGEAFILKELTTWVISGKLDAEEQP